MLACTFGDCREGQQPRCSATGLLTENTDVALANVYDGRLIVSLYEARDEYEKLNKKVCLML